MRVKMHVVRMMVVVVEGGGERIKHRLAYPVIGSLHRG